MKYKKWWDFIYENMIDGTATEISKHINIMKQKLGYRPGRVDASSSVREHLPKHSNGPSKNRQIDAVLHYDKETRIYSKLSNNQVIKTTLILKNDRGTRNVTNEEEITIARVKDLSINHKRMLDIIEKYAINSVKENIIESYSIEKTYDIDYLEKTKGGFNIYEVKSYANSIYTAIGQLLFYRSRLVMEHTINDVNMFIVGNFEISDKYNKVLKDTNIKYKHIEKFKN